MSFSKKLLGIRHGDGLNANAEEITNITIDVSLNERQVFVFDPDETNIVETLRAKGVEVERATSGSAIMLAAQNDTLAGVLIAPGCDRELRDLFVAALKTQFSNINIAAFVNEGDTRGHHEAREDGVDHVVSLPLAESSISLFAQWFGDDHISPMLVEPQAPTISSKRLAKKAVVVAEHKHAAVPLELVSKEELESVIKKHTQHSTTLRSELTLVREHSKLLKKRIGRLEHAMAEVLSERDALSMRLKKAESTPAGPKAELKKIGKQAENFIWGLEQTITLLEELSFEAGEKAPVLERHVKIVNLTRNMLLHIQEVARASEEVPAT